MSSAAGPAIAEEELVALARAALERVERGGAEAIVTEEEDCLTRFALNAVHQNVARRSRGLRLRVVDEGRVGVAAVSADAPDAAGRVAAAAERARRLSPPSDQPPLPSPDAAAGGAAAFSAATASASADMRADAAGVVVRAASARGLEAFGAVETVVEGRAIVNTNGVERSAVTTRAGLVAVVRGPDGSGYADRHSPDAETLGPAALADEVVETCSRNQSAAVLEPGRYEVVLAPYAVTDLLSSLSAMGFSALAHQEARSFLRLGERLMAEAVTIDDDAADPARAPFPFDWEGVTTRRVTLVDRGAGAGFVHDSATAARERVGSTGHALPMPNPLGPQAAHLAMAPGGSSLGDLIGSVRRGLFVTRLWYVRHVHPLLTVITGMTRDGTFLIEDGRLGAAVRDLRFTQSVAGALDDVRGIGRERSLHLGEGGDAVLAPALHLGSFTFTS